jgi:hypothetical protein
MTPSACARDRILLVVEENAVTIVAEDELPDALVDFIHDRAKLAELTATCPMTRAFRR